MQDRYPDSLPSTSSQDANPSAGSICLFGRCAALLAGTMGVTGLIGHLSWIDAMMTVQLGRSMKLNTALCILLAATSLWAYTSVSPRPLFRRVSSVCTLLLWIIAAITLVEYAFEPDLGIDELLLEDSNGRSSGSAYPGRMALNTCVNLMLTAISLLLLHRGRLVASQLLALLAAAIAVLALLGHLFGVQGLSRIVSVTPMGLSTAFALTSVNAGLMSLRPRAGLFSSLTLPFRQTCQVLALLFALLSLTAWSWWSTKSYLTSRSAHTFTIATTRVRLSIEDALAQSALVLRAASALLENDRTPSVQEWQESFARLETQSTIPILGIGFSRLVQPDRLQELRAPILLIAPELNYAALLPGHDLMADPGSRRVIENSTRTGRLEITPAMEQTGDRIDASVVLLILAVLARSHAGQPPVIGFAFSAVSIQTIVRRALPLEQGIGYEIYSADGADLLYASHPDLERRRGSALFGETAPISLDGEQLLLRAASLPNFESGELGALPETILFCGVVISLAVSCASALLMRSRHQMEELTVQTALLTRAKGDLEQSNLELRQFAYVASHDLQSPLRSIVSFTQLLQESLSGKVSASAEDWMKRTIKNALRMQTLVGDILEYAQLDSGTRPLMIVDLNQAVANALEMLALPIQETGAEIDCGNLPTVVGDASQLSRLLQNLIGNALKYHGADPPRVEIFWKKIGSEFRVSVRDNGIGIELEHHQKIFEIFRRLHVDGKFSGSGIGLSICRRVVLRHGGRIWLESELGKGSTFHFTIPDPTREQK